MCRPRYSFAAWKIPAHIIRAFSHTSFERAYLILEGRFACPGEQPDGSDFIVMDCIEGESLDDVSRASACG
jgi:hypothetical protein